MIGFFIKKNFFDGWDHVLSLVFPNLLMFAWVIGGYFLADAALNLSLLASILVLALFWCGTFIAIFAFGSCAAEIANFKSVTFKEWLKNFPLVWKDGLIFGLITGLLTMLGTVTIPFYLQMEGMIGLFKAVRDYNEDKDCSFASFAQLCISRQLYSALEASNRKKHGPLNTYVSFSLEEQEGQLVFEDFFSRKTSSPEEWILEQEKLKELQMRMKERLSSMEQQVLELYLEGNNYIQISEILEKSPKSIDNALQRIRQKIRQLQE